MCSVEELEALVAGRLDDEARARVAAHAAVCDECKEELAWLRAEAELMTRRRESAAEPAAELWDGIAARIANPPVAAAAPSQPRWSWSARVAYGGLIVAAAAAVVLVTLPGVKLFNRGLRDSTASVGRLPRIAAEPSVRKKLSPSETFDRAEAEYRDAAAVLEQEYQQQRGKLPAPIAEQYDHMLHKTRTQIADARTAAGSDVDGRMVVLDGYADYLRSLQTIVTDIR